MSTKLRQGTRWVLGLALGLSVTLAAGAQDFDTDKPLAGACTPGSAERPAPIPPPEIQLDQWFDVSNPVFGFAPVGSDTLTEEKLAEESCNTPEARVVEDDPYDKPGREDIVLAPCAIPYTQSIQAGLRDQYVLPQEPANLTPAIMAAAGVPNPARWTGFDQPQPNFHFGHQFQVPFSSFFGYPRGLLTIHLRPLPDIATNDTVSLWVSGRPGWGASLSSLIPITPGREAILQLDLRTLATNNNTSNILADINQAPNQAQDLNVYIQDDTSVDDMVLTLSCGPEAEPQPIVGVIMDSRGCGSLPAYDVFLDNEDKRNANNRGGWIGGTISNKNTQFRLCAVDGRLFTPAAQAGANFALVSLSSACPEGFTRFDRYHDNEDNRPASWDNLPSTSPTRTTQPQKNTNMAFCVATGKLNTVPNSTFPVLGAAYGVFGGRSATSWALDRGWVFLDDEDNRNQNSPASPPSYTQQFLEAGKNTKYYMARVK